jgi:hypothetical protein
MNYKPESNNLEQHEIMKLLMSVDTYSDIFTNHQVLIPKVLDPKIEC